MSSPKLENLSSNPPTCCRMSRRYPQLAVTSAPLRVLAETSRESAVWHRMMSNNVRAQTFSKTLTGSAVRRPPTATTSGPFLAADISSCAPARAGEAPARSAHVRPVPGGGHQLVCPVRVGSAVPVGEQHPVAAAARECDITPSGSMPTGIVDQDHRWVVGGDFAGPVGAAPIGDDQLLDRVS